MPKTKFQEFIFTFITSGCMIFIMGVYNVARTLGCYLQTRTAFFPIGMVHRASLCILHCQQNVQILRIPRGKINWPTNLHHPLHPDLHSLYNGAASYSVTCSLPPTKEMNLKSNTKWNSRDLQNNLLIISYTIVPPVSYLFAHRRSYHLFFHISIFKCNYLFHTPVFHNPGIPEYTFPLPHALKL